MGMVNLLVKVNESNLNIGLRGGSQKFSMSDEGIEKNCATMYHHNISVAQTVTLTYNFIRPTTRRLERLSDTRLRTMLGNWPYSTHDATVATRTKSV